MATDDHGGNPTDLSGVTFIGRPDGGGNSYHIRRNTGKVLGPFDIELILQMIRGRKLSGDEAISTDRQSWSPILSEPSFAAAFRASEGGSAQDLRDRLAAASGQRSVSPTASAQVGGPKHTALGMASVSGRPTPSSLGDDDALSGVPGIRRMSPAGEPSQPGSELPMPEGFTHFPLGQNDGPSFPFSPADSQMPSSPPPLGASGELELDPNGDSAAPMPAEGFSGTWESVDDHQHTIEDPNFGQDLPRLAEGFSDLPQSAQGPSDLPISAGHGFSDLPQSAGSHFSDLPQSAGANLPRSADPFHNLPGSTDGRTNLPQSTDRTNLPGSTFGRPNLPQSAAELPHSTAHLPANPGAGAGAPQFGTMAMSGIGIEPTQVEGQSLSDPFGTQTELPASSRATGTAILDSMAQTDDIWAGPSAPGHTQAQPGGGFHTEAMTAPLDRPSGNQTQFDPFAADAFGDAFGGDSGNVSTLHNTANEGDDFADFFPGAEEEADLPLAEPLEPLEPVEPAAAGQKRRPSGKSWGLRIGLMVVLLAVLGGAAVLLTKIASGPADTEGEVVVAPIETRPVTVAELPPLASLSDGSYQSYVDFLDAARTAVGDRGTPDDRAAFLLAGALLFSEHPEHADLFAEMRETNAALVAEDAEPEDAALVAVAKGAYLAVTADDGALEALAASEGGPYGAYAHLFSGVYHVQVYRGVDVELEPEPEPEPAEDEEAEAEAAEGEGEEEAVADGDEPTEEADTPIVDEEALEEQAAVAPRVTIVRELSADAARSFDAAIAADADLVPAHYWRGWAALEAGEPEQAQTFFEAALEKNPEHVASDIGVAVALLRQARLADADTRIQHVIDDFEAVSSSMQRSDTFEVAGEIATARMQPEIAIESLLSALQANPVNESALDELGNQFFDAAQYARAVEYFENVSDAGEAAPAVQLGLAKGLIGMESFDAARSELEEGMEQNPADGRFPYWLGRVYEQEAEFDLARQYYRQAAQIDPANVRPLVRLAQLAERENKPGDALRLLNQAVEANEGNASMANEIGEMYLRLGETNRAVSAFRRALDIDESQPRARINLTEYYLDSGQQARAIEQLDVMLESGVESPRVRFLNARALLGMGEQDRAIEELLVLLEGSPDNAEYLMLLGQAHFEAGNYSTSREQFVRAYGQDPTLALAQFYIGRCDIELGGYNEAITSLTAASQRSTSGEYHYWLGVALERAEQPSQALSEYEKTIRDDVAWSLAHPEVYASRGRLNLVRGRLVSAYRDLRTVLTLQPDHALAAENLGRVHYEQRQYTDAIIALEYSLELAPDTPSAHYVAGLAYLRLEPAALDSALEHLVAARDAGYGATEPELYQKLAYVYRDLNQRGSAADALEAYLAAAAIPYDEQRETENEIRRLRGQR